MAGRWDGTPGKVKAETSSAEQGGYPIPNQIRIYRV